MTDPHSDVRIVDYGHRDEQSRQDPWPRWKKMRGHDVAFSPAHGGFFVIPDYREVVAAVCDTDAYSNAHGTGIPVLPLANWRIADPASITWNASATRGVTSLRLTRK